MNRPWQHDALSNVMLVQNNLTNQGTPQQRLGTWPQRIIVAVGFEGWFDHISRMLSREQHENDDSLERQFVLSIATLSQLRVNFTMLIAYMKISL